MRRSMSDTISRARKIARGGAEQTIRLLALGVALASLGAAFGLWPWLEMPLRFGDQGLPAPTAQLLLTILALLWAARGMNRADSARVPSLTMEDVARAYGIAHAADRKGLFLIAGEFEQMRARLEHLRQHPDLSHLEPELLDLAAEMSFVSRDLARIYADDKVARARTFLTQRQEEVHQVSERLAAARKTCDELRRWLNDIEADEKLAQARIRQLEADLHEILPALGYDFDHDEPESNVVPLNKPGK